MIGKSRSSRSSILGERIATTSEYDGQIVGRHRHHFMQCEAGSFGQRHDFGIEAADSPEGIAGAQILIECSVRRRGIRAIPFERPI